MPILYIGGYGRSGSTVLDQHISILLGGVSLGEAVYFPRSLDRNDICSCGCLPGVCSFWQEAANQLLSNQNSVKLHSFREDGLLGLVTPPSQMYCQVQKSIFKDLSSTIYCDSSKTCRDAILRPLSLERLFPGQLLFVWLQRPLLDTIAQSLIKGTNQQLENGTRSHFVLLRILRGTIGYIYANAAALFYAIIVFRKRSVLIDQRQLLRQPNTALNQIADLVQRSTKLHAQTMQSPAQPDKNFDQSFGSLHQIAGNRNRKRF